MTMLPTFLAGTNWVMHSAGWLESGLASGYEKFIVDIEILRMMQKEFKPFEIRGVARATPPEVGHGGHSSARRTCSSTSATASTSCCCRRR